MHEGVRRANKNPCDQSHEDTMTMFTRRQMKIQIKNKNKVFDKITALMGQKSRLAPHNIAGNSHIQLIHA